MHAPPSWASALDEAVISDEDPAIALLAAIENEVPEDEDDARSAEEDVASSDEERAADDDAPFDDGVSDDEEDTFITLDDATLDEAADALLLTGDDDEEEDATTWPPSRVSTRRPESAGSDGWGAGQPASNAHAAKRRRRNTNALCTKPASGVSKSRGPAMPSLWQQRAARGSVARVYQLRPPAPALRPFIEHYWFVTSDDGPVDIRVDVFVDARADLIFNFGAPYEREVIHGTTVRLARSNFDAQRLEPIRIIQRGLVRTCGVRFKAGGVGPFVDGPLKRWTGGTPAVHEVLGDGAAELDRALAGEKSPDAQAAMLDAFFLARMKTDGPFEHFSRALSACVSSDGAASVEQLAGLAGVSERHVDRLFARFLGVAPKTVARVLRFQRALRMLMRDPGCTLADVAADAGYFDQAHFIRDFRKMSGGVPRGYRGYYPARGPNDFAPNVVVFVQDGAR